MGLGLSQSVGNSCKSGVIFPVWTSGKIVSAAAAAAVA